MLAATRPRQGPGRGVEDGRGEDAAASLAKLDVAGWSSVQSVAVGSTASRTRSSRVRGVESWPRRANDGVMGSGLGAARAEA